LLPTPFWFYLSHFPEVLCKMSALPEVFHKKSRPLEILSFKLDYFLPSAFLHWYFNFLTIVLMDFWLRKLVLFCSASFAFSLGTSHGLFILILRFWKCCWF
jgi:hypothetical protein